MKVNNQAENSLGLYNEVWPRHNNFLVHLCNLLIKNGNIPMRDACKCVIIAYYVYIYFFNIDLIL